MDMIMTELSAALPVDIMPGPDDPANVSLPQQPLHQCLFPGSVCVCGGGGGWRELPAVAPALARLKSQSGCGTTTVAFDTSLVHDATNQMPRGGGGGGGGRGWGR
jgi:hypothetical protein